MLDRVEHLVFLQDGRMVSTLGQHQRKSLRYTGLRGLIVLIIAASLAMSWAVYRVRIQMQAVSAIEQAGGNVKYDGAINHRLHVFGQDIGWPRWLIDRLGIDWFESVKEVFLKNVASDSILLHVGQLDKVEELYLSRSPVTDQGVSNLRGLSRLRLLALDSTAAADDAMITLGNLTSLRKLYLGQTLVGDRGLSHVSRLNRLEELFVEQTKITDECAPSLAALKSLIELKIGHNRMTNRCLPSLESLSNLTYLSILGTSIDSAGLTELQRSLPNTSISSWALRFRWREFPPKAEVLGVTMPAGGSK